MWPIDMTYQVQPLRVKVKLETVEMKGTQHSPKLQCY